MSDVWGAFGGGYELGRQDRRNRRLGEAYQSGGLEAVETAAGEMGDLEAANYAGTMRRRERQFEDERTQAAYERMEKIRPYALGTIAELGRRPIGQRGAYLANPNVRRYFIDWGFTEDQLNSAAQTLDSENGDQFLQELRAGFTQHQNRDWTLTTLPTADGQGFEQRPIAINPETGDIDIGQGSIPAAPGEVEAFGNGGLWRRNPSAPGGYEVLREPRSGGGGDGGPTETQIFSRANSLRDEYVAQTASYRTVADFAARSERYVQRANAGEPSGQGDVGLVYALAKIYDPTSVVREGEFEMVARQGGYGEQFQTWIETARGRGFSPAIRNQIMAEIRNGVQAQQAQRDQTRARYVALAERTGIDPALVIDEYGVATQLPTQPPPGATRGIAGVGAGVAGAGGGAEDLDAREQELLRLREELMNGGR